MNSGMYENIMEQPAVFAAILSGFGEYEKAFANTLRGKENLFFVATGASLNAALAVVPAFAKYYGRVPCVIPAAEVSHYQQCFDENSAVVLISQSGDSHETKEMCRLMREKGLPFWGITNEEESTLARQATKVLFMKAGKEVSSATKTQTATMLLLLLVAAESDANAMRALAGLPELTREILECGREKVWSIAEALKSKTVLYALGDNLHAATARQIALMLKEKGQIFVEGMTGPDFRHGAVEIVDKGLPFLYVAPTQAHRTESETHVRFLNSLGAEVYLCAESGMPEVEESHFIPLSYVGEDVLTPLTAVLPFQLLAERLAAVKGLDVDGFRYLAKVVGKY